MSNCVTVQNLRAFAQGDVDRIAHRLAQLEPRTQIEVVRRAWTWARRDAESEIGRLRGMGLTGMGQAEAGSAVDSMIANALGPIVPGLQRQIMAAVQPAMDKAVNIIKPTLAQELPVFAVITGAVGAFFTVLGMYLFGRYFMRKMA